MKDLMYTEEQELGRLLELDELLTKQRILMEDNKIIKAFSITMEAKKLILKRILELRA